MAKPIHKIGVFRGHDVSSLRAQIMRLRIPVDSGDRYFIPQGPLTELITKETVHKAISACAEIEPYQVAELVDVILKGAIKVFAILVLLKGEEGLILSFVENDGFQKATLDARLPFHRSQIEALVPEETVEDFNDRQWEFVVPFFSKAIIHRVMAPRTRLPFVLDRDTGKEGGFGHIYEIQIHPEYHEFSFTSDEKGHPRLVRKEFLPNSSDQGSFKQETDNLNILNQIKHPNIIEMIGSYTYRGKHNAIFPLATGGHLASFMAEATQPARFSEDFDIYRALSELSSAIEVVHNYTAKSIDLTLIGVHHDLKPENVLVHEGTFVLADFGLTKFKSADQTSKSMFKVGGGHYLAPECEDYQEAFRKNSIGRSSDIWSFGCILAEMATYMCHGADGVTAFRAARKVNIASFTTYTFHAGLNTPNPGVVEWLDKLEKNFQEIPIVDIIKEMLNVNPSLRPNSSDVTLALRYCAVKAYARHVQAQFETLLVKYASHELEAQQRLFEAWYETLPLWLSDNVEANDEDDGLESVLRMALQAMIQRLEEIRKEMELIALRYGKATSPLFHNLRHVHEELIELLPTKWKRRTYSRFELWMMQQDEATLDIEHQNLSDSYSMHSRKLTMLATMRRLNRMTLDPSTNQKFVYHLASDAVQIVKRFEDHMLGVLRRTPAAPAQLVLIEQVHYDTHWEGAVSEEMFTRMAAIAELLQNLSKPGNLPILPCQGFYHMLERFSFGFVFECPPAYYFSSSASQAAPTDVCSLADIIDTTDETWNRPSLDDRFYLAQLLASTLLDFHKAGWLHKSISPYNVISFKTVGSSAAEWLRRPYLIGFNRSRQDQATAFTEGPNAADKSLEYMYPQYLEDKCRFRRGFDYYSLGLVLLEIGLWHLLHTVLTRRRIFPPKMSENVLKTLLTEVVPMLNHTMGVDYCRAVHECLSWDTTIDDAAMTEEKRAGLLLKFERLVVGQIRGCSMSENLRDSQPLHSSVEDNRLINDSPRSAATAFGASQNSSLPEKSGQHQKEALENDAQALPKANASFDALDPESESPDLSTPKARIELVKSDRSGYAGPVPSSDTLRLGPEPSGLDTPRPSKPSMDFSFSSAQSAYAMSALEHQKRHHLGPPSFDNPPRTVIERPPRMKELWPDAWRKDSEQGTDPENALGILGLQ